METKATIFIVTTSLLTILSPGLYGVLGAAGFYVHEILQDPQAFSWVVLGMYCFLGFVVGMMVHSMTTEILGYSYPGLLIAAGFSVRRISEIAEKYVGVKLKLPKK